MKIKSSDGRVIEVPANYQSKVKALMDAGDHAGMEALYGEIESKSFKKGGMLKRKDGSYSKRGLWDNIRANKGSGRKPTKEMLEQEAEINNKMGKGGYTVKRSSDRKGKTHVVIGPDGTKKYFGDSKLGQHPDNPGRKKSFYARHKHNLAGNPYFRAFARATWAEGGKLERPGTRVEGWDSGEYVPDNYGFGGHTYDVNPSQLGAGAMSPSTTNMYNYGGRVDQYGYPIPIYGLGGLLENFTKTKVGGLATDAVKFGADTTLSTVGAVTTIDSLKDVVKDKSYHTAAFDKASNVAGAIGDVAGTAAKFIPITAPFAAAAGAVGGLADNAFNIDKKFYDPREHQSGIEKASKITRQVGDVASMFVNPANIASNAIGKLGKAATIATKVGKAANTANMGLNMGKSMASGQGVNPMQLMQMGMQLNGLGSGMFNNNSGNTANPATNVTGAMDTLPIDNSGSPFASQFFGHGGYIMADGGPIDPQQLAAMQQMSEQSPQDMQGMMPQSPQQSGMVPINIEGGNVSSVAGSKVKKGELLVDPKTGAIIKDYSARPPHPAVGQNPNGDDDATEGLVVIPKIRVPEYMTADPNKRKQMIRSIVSQQENRERIAMNKKDAEMNKALKKLADGGYVSPGMFAMGGELGYDPETLDATMMAKGGWIQKATASIKRRGTEGVCTGSKFGSSSCPPGSRRYNLAKTFKKMARARHEDGGFVDPVTGSYDIKYSDGGRLRYDQTAVVSPEQTSTAGNYGPLEGFSDYGSYSYFDPSAENAIPNMQGWYGYKDNNPSQITDPILQSNLSRAYRGGNPGLPDWAYVNKGIKYGSSPTLPSGTYSITGGYRPYGPDFDAAKAKVDARTAPPAWWTEKTKGGTQNVPYRMTSPEIQQEGFNYGNLAQDLAGLAPVLYNLGKSFDKPYQMNPEEYMTPGMNFRDTRFDRTPYQQAGSRAQYALRQAGSGPGYKAAVGNIGAQMGQAESMARLQHYNAEALRRQQMDQANAEIDARNRMMRYQINTGNEQAREKQWDYRAKAAEQFGQTFGKDPMYFAAMAGKAPRQPFTGYRQRPSTSTSSGTSVNWENLKK